MLTVTERYVCFLRLVNLSAHLSEELRYLELLEISLNVDYYWWPVEIALCVLSLFVSIVNTVVLTRKTMLYSSMNILLVALELSNIVMASSQMTFSVIKFTFGRHIDNYNVSVLDTAATVLSFTSAFFMNLLTLAIGGWRFVAVTWPLKAAVRLKRRHAFVTILCSALFSSFPAIFVLLIHEVDSYQVNICEPARNHSLKNATVYLFSNIPWAKANQDLVKNVYVVVNVTYYLIPCICFAFITAGLIYNIYQHSKIKKDLKEGQCAVYIEEGQVRTNVILIVMLSAFLASNTFPVVVRLVWFSGIETSNFLFYFLNYILSSYPLSLLTNSFSFFAYYYMGTKFRRAFCHLIKF